MIQVSSGGWNLQILFLWVSGFWGSWGLLKILILGGEDESGFCEGWGLVKILILGREKVT